MAPGTIELHTEMEEALDKQKANVRESLLRERDYQQASQLKVQLHEREARDVVRATKKFKGIEKPLIPGVSKGTKPKPTR